MGKMKRSYRIFLLFLLVSMSVFAGIRTRVENVNSENYNKIKINLISITNNDVESMRIINLKEKRKESYKDYDSIQADRVELENGTKIKIGAEDYIIENNKTTTKVTGYNNIDKVQYIYGWIGTYNTYFTEEKGEERTVSFDAERVLDISRKPKYTVTGLLGTYTEPTKIEPTPESGEQYIYSQIAKENLDRTDSGGFWGIGSKYYNISFYNDLKELKSVGAGNKSLKGFLTSDESYEGEIFTQKNGKVYLYNGENRPMVEFKLTKNTGNPYNGTFKFIKHGFWETINESYKIPAPTINFVEVNSKSSKNVFTYDEADGNRSGYGYQEVVFRLYTGDKKDGLRPIKKIEDNNLTNNSYIDFVFKNDGEPQEITQDGMTGKFIEEKFELMGLEDGESYKLDFYTLRYKNNNNTGNYVVTTYEDSLGFVGKNPNEPVETPSSQWIYSQITKANLVNSDKYKVDFYENVYTIKTIDKDGNLEGLLKIEGGYSDDFIQRKKERYEYIGDPKSIIEFKLEKNKGELYEGKFKLDEHKDDEKKPKKEKEDKKEKKNKIDQKYNIPAPTTNFSVDGNVFSYEDEKDEGKSKYNYQEVVFRLYTGNKKNEIRPIKKLEKDDNLDNIYDGDNYVDFVFEKDHKGDSIELEGGITGTFKEKERKGRKNKKRRWEFKLEGLNESESYKVDFYTLRYGDNKKDKKPENQENHEYVVVTYENTFEFGNDLPKITEVSLTNETLKSFLETMYTIDGAQLEFEEENSKYKNKSPNNIPDNFRGKLGDKIHLELIVKGKNIDEYDVANGIAINGWLNPIVESYANNDDHELKKFKVIWENGKVDSDDKIIVKNNIEVEGDLKANQNLTVLDIDNSDIEVEPKVSEVTPIKDDEGKDIYYVNTNYIIDLVADKSKAGVLTMEYNSYDGKKGNTFIGGEKGNNNIKIDLNNDYSKDGEYRIRAYGMNKSGKLNDISSYSGTFDDIMLGSEKTNVNLIVRLDTVAPKITLNGEGKRDIKIVKTEESVNFYYFDISFKMDDFNPNYKVLDGEGGGYSLLKNFNSKIVGTPTIDKLGVVKYSVEVNKNKGISNGVLASVKVIMVDKAGNKNDSEIIEIKLPKDIEVETYEVATGDWFNASTGEMGESVQSVYGHLFTKGGNSSYINSPIIYAKIESGDGADIKHIKVMNSGRSEKINVPEGKISKIEIKGELIKTGENIVTLTPISELGIEGKSKEFKFVVDTRVDTSYLEGGIIGDIGSDGKVVINLEELVGIKKYSYIFFVGEDIKIRGRETVTAESNLTIEPYSFKLDISTLAGGIGGTLELTVWDKLGHEKTFVKTYQSIGKRSEGTIISTVKGEVKRRSSKVKIINDKFSIESSIDGSSEEGPEKPEEEPEKVT